MSLLVVVAFLTMFATDFLWVRYMQAVGQRAAGMAGLSSMLLFVVSAVNTLAFVSEPLLLIPGAAGAWAGTYVAAGGLSDG